MDDHIILTPDRISAVTPKPGNYANFDPKEYPGLPGTEHYKLLVYLSQYLNESIIIDIGTHRVSAFALAHNTANTVLSFDIEAKIDPHLKNFLTFNFSSKIYGIPKFATNTKIRYWLRD